MSIRDGYRSGKQAGDAFENFFGWIKDAIQNPTRMRSISRSDQLKELKQLHERVTELYLHSPAAKVDTEELVANLVLEACHCADKKPSVGLLRPFFDTTLDLLCEEGIWAPPKVDWSRPFTLEDEVDLRKHLRNQEHIFGNFDHLTGIWLENVLNIYTGILGYLPDSIVEEDADNESEVLGFEVAFVDLLDDPAEAIQRLLVTINDDDLTRNTLFTSVRNRFERNLLVASGLDPSRPPESSSRIVPPQKAKDVSNVGLVEGYLSGTPFESFFKHQFPFTIPSESRFEHCHIVGGTGHGKTQLIQALIRDDLYGPESNRPGICVIDSQGDLIRKLSRLDIFDPTTNKNMADRFVLIDPSDVEFPVCLNLFDFHLERVGSLPAVQREMILNGTVDLFEYMFGALLGAELTQRQGVIFKYLARLMMVIPGATIQTLRELMEDAERFRPYVERLEGTTRAFFETQFYSPSFSATKKQILARLWGVLSNTALERMFSHKKNKIDLFDAMNSGKIVLISTAKDLLKKDGCQILGRFFIALLGQGVLERASMPASDRRAFHVYIDEAQEYFDERVEELLTQSRKYRVGLTLAHQALDQLSPRLRAVFASNTSIKFAGGVSSKDAVEFSREMNCPPDQIRGARKRLSTTEFSCYAKHITARAINLTVPLGLIEGQPQLNDESYARLIEVNRSKYAAPPVPYTPPAPLKKEQKVPSKEKTHKDEVIPRKAEKYVESNLPQPKEVRAKEKSPIETRSVNVREGAASPPVPSGPIPKAPTAGRGGPQHTYLQRLIKRLSEERGYRASVEEQILGGKGSVGSTQILRTLQRSSIMGKRSVYVKAKKLQPGVQAGCR